MLKVFFWRLKEAEARPVMGTVFLVYKGMSVVCQINCVGGITWPNHAHAQSQFWEVKNRPVIPVLFISTRLYARADLAWTK